MAQLLDIYDKNNEQQDPGIKRISMSTEMVRNVLLFNFLLIVFTFCFRKLSFTLSTTTIRPFTIPLAVKAIKTAEAKTKFSLWLCYQIFSSFSSMSTKINLLCCLPHQQEQPETQRGFFARRFQRAFDFHLATGNDAEISNANVPEA